MSHRADCMDGGRLVGRAAELAALTGVAAEVRGGSARAVLVTGAGGMGKTGLLAMAHAKLQRRDGAVLHTTGEHGLARYEAVRDLFAPLGLTNPSTAESSTLVSGPARQALPALMPCGRSDLGDSGHDDVYPTLYGLYRLAVNLMADGPLTIMLDDAERCDLPTLRWVHFLFHRAADLPLFVVLGCSTEAVGPGWELVTALAGHIGCTTIELGPLSEPDVAELIADTLGQKPEQAFVDRCTELTGGRPAPLHTLLAELRAHRVRPDEQEIPRVAGISGQALTGLVSRWLREQPGDVCRTAIGVALLGPVEGQVVGMLFGMSAPAVDAAVRVLRRHAVLLRGRLDFVHGDMRDAVLEALPAGELEVLRLRSARLLRDAGCPYTEIARQVAGLSKLDEPWMRVALREAAADARRHGHAEEAKWFLERAVEAASGQFENLNELAKTLLTGDADAVVHEDVAFRVLGDVLGEFDTDRELRSWVEWVALFVGLGDPSTIPDALERARQLAVPDRSTPADRWLLAMLASTAMLDGETKHEATRRARLAVSDATEVDAPVRMFAGTVLYKSDCLEEARKAIVRPLGLARQDGDAWTNCWALGLRSMVLRDAGDLAAAAADAQSAMEIAGQESWAVPRIALAAVLIEQADARRVDALLDELVRPHPVWERPMALVLRGRALRKLGDQEGALAQLLRCGRELDEAGIRNPMLATWWLTAALMLTDLGRRAEAKALIEAQAELAYRWGTHQSVGAALLAQGATTPGRRGLELMSEAVDRLAAGGDRLLHVRAEYYYGRELFRADNLVQARTYLRQAVDRAVRCGYTILGTKASKQLVAAGGRMRKLPGGRLDLLTERERRVAALAAAGATNREIAEELFITLRTVETHLSSVYRKLGVYSRKNLVSALGAGVAWNAGERMGVGW